MAVDIRKLSPTEAREAVSQLADLLVQCVAGGASVSFLAPFTFTQAREFFDGVIDEVEKGRRLLLAAFDEGQLAGSVQIVPATPPNQPHRADVAKLLVAPTARRRGIGNQLMLSVEDHARRAGKTLLVLDTVTGSGAEALYLRLGWTKVGIIPDYALFPDGRLCDTTIFWKKVL